MTENDIRQKLIEIVARTSYEDHRKNPIKLASGKLSEHYVDCKKALSHPDACEWLGTLIWRSVRDYEFTSAGGLELGAYPIAQCVSAAAFRDGRRIKSFVVRKMGKEYGKTDLIAGDVRSGDRALVVDDVITSGSSVVRAIENCREAGLTVVGAVVIVDREQDNGRRNIEACGVWLKSVLTLKDLTREHEREFVSLHDGG
jgi:orotate phosphoribosyltransferase